ncbi:MAG: septum formation initiator family protein [Oscillospiraceae bacterium]|nr:septum formation initiator family protein [Oscillospiraceae bacterium]
MKNWSFSVKLAVLAFLIFGVATTVQLSTEISEQEDKLVSMTERRDNLADEIDGLLDEIQRPKDEDFIKRLARESLNYYMPNEIVFYNDIAG